MHLISYNWLPFYRPCSFASQTFICFADFLIIAFKLMQKNWFYYTIALYCTQEKHYRFNARKQKKNSRYIYSNCSSTSEVHEALTLLLPIYRKNHSYPNCKQFSWLKFITSKSPSRTRHHLQLVQKNINRMLLLINQVLDFRKIQNKKMGLTIDKRIFRVAVILLGI